MGFRIRVFHVVLDLGRIHQAGGAAPGDAEHLPDLDGPQFPAALDLTIHNGGGLYHLAVQAVETRPAIRGVSVNPVLVIHLHRGIGRPGVVTAVDQRFVIIVVATGVAPRRTHGKPAAVELPAIDHDPDVLIAYLHDLLGRGGCGHQHHKREG